MKSLTATFDLPMTFPKGMDGKSSARTRLELKAKEKLATDMKSKGYRLVEETFQAIWSDAINGSAFATGYLIVNGEPET